MAFFDPVAPPPSAQSAVVHDPAVPDSAHVADTHITTRGAHLPHLPGLDGLRAVAVLAVVLYHADVTWLRGGFLGVEVFFVISGYLITALLLGEWGSRGRIDLPAFWLRRARRLLPALFLLLVAVLVFAVIVLPSEVAGLRTDALAAFAYVTNWYLIFGHKSYFETVGRPSLLQHLWSLAVEEQFYLLWPLLLSVGLAVWRRRVVWLVAAGALAATLLMALLYDPLVDPSRIYYGTDTRSGGLLIGAVLAFLWTPWQRQRRVARIPSRLLDGIGAVALLGVVVAFLRISENQDTDFLYRGGITLVALATAAVIAAIVAPASLLGPVLDVAPLRWVGTRSYSIYLWHWPVVVLTRPHLDVPIDGLPLLVVRLLLTGLLAEASYRFVETPVRGGALGRAWKRWHTGRGPVWQRLGTSGNIVAGAIALFALLFVVAILPAKAPATPADFAVASISTTVAPPTATPPPTPTDAPTRAIVAVGTEVPPTATPAPTPTPVPHRITAFGDSVMLGAAEALQNRFPNIEIEASVGVHFSEAIDLVKARRDKNELGDIVLIHLGNNGGFTKTHFDWMMDAIGKDRKVIFVNLKVPRAWQDDNNYVLADGVKRYPNTVLVDWLSASSPHPEFFKDDGFHLLTNGREFYANLLAPYLK